MGGIDASAKPATTREQIARTAGNTGRLIGVQEELTEADVELEERCHAGVYGIPDGADAGSVANGAGRARARGCRRQS